MAEDKRLELRVSDEWLARLDAVRGDVPRGRFVKRALEQALGESNVGAGETSPRLDPTPVRAPKSPARDRDGGGSPATATAPAPVRPVGVDPLAAAAAVDLASQRPFRCKTAGCPYGAMSPQALCPTHGRKVVPA